MPASVRDGVEQAMARYVHALDDRDWEALRGVFAEDCTFHMGEAVRGVDNIVAALSRHSTGAPPSRHLVSGLEITEAGEDEVATVSDWAVLVPSGDAWVVSRFARHNDRLRRQGDEWVYTEMRITLAGA